VSFVGTDIGGFHWHSSSELWARWIELGAFYPFSRGHSVTTARQKEPWMWGERTEKIARKYIELRYQLLPYLYTLFEESARTGSPIMRPLLYEFYTDPQVLELHDEVMVGSGLLLAPVYRPGVQYRHVYLPGGNWYDFWSGEIIREAHVMAHAPLEVLPLYVRAGTVLPLGPLMQYSNERPLNPLVLEIYLDEQGAATGQLYEDDGESFAYAQGESCITTYTVTTEAASPPVLCAQRQGQFEPPLRSVEIRLYSSTGVKSYVLPQDKGNWTLVLHP
jgi:alpha-glucosidase